MTQKSSLASDAKILENRLKQKLDDYRRSCNEASARADLLAKRILLYTDSEDCDPRIFNYAREFEEISLACEEEKLRSARLERALTKLPDQIRTAALLILDDRWYNTDELCRLLCCETAQIYRVRKKAVQFLVKYL